MMPNEVYLALGPLVSISPMNFKETKRFFHESLDACCGIRNFPILDYLSLVMAEFAANMHIPFGSRSANAVYCSNFQTIHEVVDWYQRNRVCRDAERMEMAGRHVLFLAGFIRLDIGPSVTEAGSGAFYFAASKNKQSRIFYALSEDLHYWQRVLNLLRQYLEDQKLDIRNYLEIGESVC